MLPTPLDPRAGDLFAQALETCRHFLLAVANVQMPGRLTPRCAASDLVQETLVKGYTARDQFRGRTLADLRAWLRGILANELAAFRRHCRAACRDAAREVPVETISLPAQAPEPIDDMIRGERAAAALAAVARLPAEARQVLVLRLELRLGFREIGARLGRTEEAVRKVFTRTLEQLRATAPDTAA